VLASIDRATKYAERSQAFPVLHLEAHGGENGLTGPDGADGTESLTWTKLNPPLQKLNFATRCNLMVVVAACTGFAAIQTFFQGPRAPAFALVGPDSLITPRDLLQGTKEFYRRCNDENAKVDAMAASASQEAGTVTLCLNPSCFLPMKHWLRVSSSIRGLPNYAVTHSELAAIASDGQAVG
jgi:hypothetical protein